MSSDKVVATGTIISGKRVGSQTFRPKNSLRWKTPAQPTLNSIDLKKLESTLSKDTLSLKSDELIRLAMFLQVALVKLKLCSDSAKGKDVRGEAAYQAINALLTNPFMTTQSTTGKLGGPDGVIANIASIRAAKDPIAAGGAIQELCCLAELSLTAAHALKVALMDRGEDREISIVGNEIAITAEKLALNAIMGAAQHDYPAQAARLLTLLGKETVNKLRTNPSPAVSPRAPTPQPDPATTPSPVAVPTPQEEPEVAIGLGLEKATIAADKLNHLGHEIANAQLHSEFARCLLKTADDLKLIDKHVGEFINEKIVTDEFLRKGREVAEAYYRVRQAEDYIHSVSGYDSVVKSYANKALQAIEGVANGLKGAVSSSAEREAKFFLRIKMAPFIKSLSGRAKIRLMEEVDEKDSNANKPTELQHSDKIKPLFDEDALLNLFMGVTSQGAIIDRNNPEIRKIVPKDKIPDDLLNTCIAGCNSELAKRQELQCAMDVALNSPIGTLPPLAEVKKRGEPKPEVRTIKGVTITKVDRYDGWLITIENRSINAGKSYIVVDFDAFDFAVGQAKNNTGRSPSQEMEYRFKKLAKGSDNLQKELFVSKQGFFSMLKSLNRPVLNLGSSECLHDFLEGDRRDVEYNLLSASNFHGEMRFTSKNCIINNANFSKMSGTWWISDSLDLRGARLDAKIEFRSLDANEPAKILVQNAWVSARSNIKLREVEIDSAPKQLNGKWKDLWIALTQFEWGSIPGLMPWKIHPKFDGYERAVLNS